MNTLTGLTGDAPIGLEHYLVVAALMFVFGLMACLMRRNAIGILIGIELILNASILNFMAFWRFHGGTTVEGPLFGLFIILLAASEAAIALAILLNMFFNFGSIDVDRAGQMKR